MDSQREKTIYFSNTNNNLSKNEKFKIFLKLFIILIISFFLIDIIIDLRILNFSVKSNAKLENKFLQLKIDLNKAISMVKELMKIKTIEIEEFNEIINDEYIQNQNNFCNNINKYLNYEIENKIKLAKIIFNNLTYNMFVYKNKDVVSYFISKINSWEKFHTNNLIKGLNFYSKKKIYLIKIFIY